MVEQKLGGDAYKASSKSVLFIFYYYSSLDDDLWRYHGTKDR
jgi:hypothetical protein